MSKVRIEQLRGEAVKADIDDFYKRNGSKGTARKDDLFFVAYSGNQMIGCVRFCIEEGIPMLRTMYIDSSCRQQGVGRNLLKAFGEYLDKNNIKNVFCLPYTHLEKFYGLINFKIVEAREVPKFLIDRAAEYAQRGTRTLFMGRL